VRFKTATENWRKEADQKKNEGKPLKKQPKTEDRTQTKNVLSWRVDGQKLPEESENSWSALQKKRAKNLNSTGKSDEEIVRAMKSILNKLTEKKYDTLYQQILDCGMSTVEHVQILIREVLEKAQTQHHFIQMYCRLCVDLNRWFVDNDIADTPENSFRRILLNECQNKFEDNLQPISQELNSVKEAEDMQEAEIKHKLGMLGNIKFIGALLEMQMLNAALLPAIAQELINAGQSHTLESLACFLTAVGGVFDKGTWKHHERLEAIFVQVEERRKDKSVPARIRFLLQDLLDLRAKNWNQPGQA